MVSVDADSAAIRRLQAQVKSLTSRVRTLETRVNSNRLGTEERPIQKIVTTDGYGRVSEIDTRDLGG